MWNNFIASLVVWCLKHKQLKNESKVKVVNELLRNIGALPLRNSISTDEQGNVCLNGKPLEVDQLVTLRASALALQDSFAFKIIHEQVRFLAVQMGVHQALNPEQVIFAKAALWHAQEETKLIKQLTGE